MWPAEGALSAAFLNQIGEAGARLPPAAMACCATRRATRRARAWPGRHRRERRATSRSSGNERLSDLLGFEYANWHGRDAAQAFMTELQAVHAGDGSSLIPVFSGRRERLGILPVQRLVLLFRPLRRARAEPGDPHRDARRGGRELLRPSPAAAAADGRQLGVARRSTWRPTTTRTGPGTSLRGQAERRLRAGERSPDARRAGRALHRLAVRESSDGFWWPGDQLPQSVARSTASSAPTSGRLPPAATTGSRQSRPPHQPRCRFAGERRHDAPATSTRTPPRTPRRKKV